MSHVRVRHEHAVAPDHRASRLCRRAVQRDELSDNRPVADLDRRRLPPVFQILRWATDRRHRMDLALLANSAAAVDDGAGSDPGSVTDCDIIFNNSKLSNLHSLSDHGLWTYDSAGVNLNRHYDVVGF